MFFFNIDEAQVIDAKSGQRRVFLPLFYLSFPLGQMIIILWRLIQSVRSIWSGDEGVIEDAKRVCRA